MERFRLKNIIILILVLLNGFLVSSLAQRRTAERDAFHRTAEQLAALFEENGMTLEPGAVSRDLPPDGVALARDTALEERAAAFLLGDALSVSDQGGGIFHYAGPAGEAFFRSSGGFDAAGTLAEADVEDFCREFCRTHPAADRLMLGRGLVGNPALVREAKGGPALGREELRDFHDGLYQSCCEAFHSEKNALRPMKEIWFYQICLFEDAGRLEKDLRKAAETTEYRTLVERIFAQCPLRAEGAEPVW